jgi:hypothetical protein
MELSMPLFSVKHHAMKIYRGIAVQLHAFLTLALSGGM